MNPFKLYPAEAAWWSFTDYQAVLDAMQSTGARRVLEFGPGSSTLALIEGGAETVDTCEDAPDWAEVYEERLVKRFPRIVRLHRYTFGDPISIPQVNMKRFDLALIDGPRSTEARAAVVPYAMDRADWVLVALEEHKVKPWLRGIVKTLAKERDRKVKFTKTGPLAGAFALIGPMEPEPTE